MYIACMCRPSRKMQTISYLRTNMFYLKFIILCLIFPLAASFSSNETDLRSLLAFKSAIDLDPLGALTSWNQTTHFCSWNGVRCSRRHRDRVVAINLRSQGLSGSLSPHIGNLSLLKSITLQNNTFHGTIPPQITLLKRLTYVEFSNNSFNGLIPQNLSNCRNLAYLNLIDNELSGAIPNDVESMTKLEALGLSKNRFSINIPPFLGNITSLTKLSLLSGEFVGEIPASFSRLRNLKFLQLGENRLTGIIPSGLFNLTALQFFGVAVNQLRGVIPSTIGLTLPNLSGLDLFENQFNGPIPASLSNASLLDRIQVYDNCFTGPMPRLERLVHLLSVDFQRNFIVDDLSFISSLTNSSKLLLLEFGGNMLTGSLPESIANLSRNIKVLNVEKNEIGGKIPSGIGNIDKLADFLAGHNFLEGRVPEEIAKLSNLRSLFLERNVFSNEVRLSFANMTFLSRVRLYNNNLSGNVPSSLANCTHLLELDLSHNNFNGFIPPEILNLSPISIVLNLSYNALEGLIPYEVGSLRNLASLDLSKNKLSGAIPDSLSKCISLERLYLDGNFLEGEIPQGLSSLVGLQELDISKNNLSGPIPYLLGKLQLHKLDLSFNSLHGEVPVIGAFKNRSTIFLEGNEGLCGGIQELKLPPCPNSLESKTKNLSTLTKILIPIVVFGGMCLILSALFIYYKQRKKATPFVPSFIGIQIMRLSYSDLLRATDEFSKANLLGVGRFGSVYKGILDHDNDQIVVAVKVLDLSVKGAFRSFLAECNALRNVRHRNLLKILSVCESIDFQGNEFKALIYDFKCNGSLEKWLHQDAKSSNSSFNMIKRLNIAIDIAQAVEYLHFGTDLSIVHGDLKPSNILLDEDMTAYVGDFGLARIISDTIMPLHESNSSSEIRGTIGYVPPEYGSSCSVSTQGDVYSYGILLLEIFTNKRPTDDLFKEHKNLRSSVGDALLDDRVMKIVDPLVLQTGLTDHGSEEKMKICMKYIMSIGVACSNEMPRERMSIAQVVSELQVIQKVLHV